MMQVAFYFGVMTLFFFLLIKSTKIVLASLRVMVSSTHVSAFGLASFLLAFSTSLPELLVGISAGLQNQGGLALGTIIGSNIANMSLVLGTAALVAGALEATDDFLKKDVFYVFLAGSLPLLLMIDGLMSRVDAIILLAVYVMYNSTVLHGQRKKLAKREIHEDPLWRRVLVRFSQKEVEQGVVKLLIGVSILIISADMVVRMATLIGQAFDVPALLIGLFIVAVGTSLPELAFEILAIRRGEVQMAFGNILGSVVTNSTLILGVTALISPITLIAGKQVYLIGTVGYIVTFAVFWGLVWSKRKLERWEGALLLLTYLLFAWFQFSKLGG